MVEKLLDRIHPPVRNLRFFEPRDDVAGRESAEDFFDCRLEVAPIRNPAGPGLKARIGCQFITTENETAESLPFAIILNTQENGFLILALERSIGGDCGVSGARTRRRL